MQTGSSAGRTSEIPSAFISYSWDDETHKAWVRGLAERLRSDGVEAVLDQWATVPGDQLPEFMESSITGNDFVLIVCTPRYKARSAARKGGVGYEGDIITAELLYRRNQRKIIPILRQGLWTDAAPSWLAGKYYIDLRDGPVQEGQYQDLLSTILGTRPKAPPVAPSSRAAQSGPVSGPALRGSSDEPVRIVGVMVDEVTEPRNDGSRGSALYAVPFRLSRRVSSEWAGVFVEVWNHPPRFTTMHRPGIARVYGDRIVLDGTTVEEVQQYHRDTLVLCVREANRIVAEHQEKARRDAEARQQFAEQHQNRVRELSKQIRFDE